MMRGADERAGQADSLLRDETPSLWLQWVKPQSRRTHNGPVMSRRNRAPGALNRAALFGGIGLILVGAAGVLASAASDVGAPYWLRAICMLGFSGIGAIAWALPDRVDFLGRSRRMMGGVFFLVGVLFATLTALGVDVVGR